MPLARAPRAASPSTRLRAASALALAAWLLAACDSPTAGHGVGPRAERQAARPFSGYAIEPLRVRVLSPPSPATTPASAEAAARASLSQRLDADALATLDLAARVPPHRRLSGLLEARAAFTPDGQRLLTLSLRLQGEDSFGPLRLEATTEDLSSPQTPLTTHIDRATDALHLALAPQLRAALSDDPTLSQTLTRSPDADALLAAIREVGRRRADAHAPALQRLLVHPSADVALATLGVLAHLRHAPSVPLIRDLLSSHDPAKVHAALYALSDIGGPDAIRALSDVADHASPPLRDLARSLRDRALLREAPPSAPD
jgi:hypothetical protein